jgi:hypothetical protein
MRNKPTTTVTLTTLLPISKLEEGFVLTYAKIQQKRTVRIFKKSYVDSRTICRVTTFMKDIEPIKWLRLKKDFKKKSIKYSERKIQCYLNGKSICV